jgi:kynurenine formamidase
MIIDLTHTFTQVMPVSPFDDQSSIDPIRTLTHDAYNDWRLSSGMHVGTHIDGPGHLTESKVLLSNVLVEKFIGNGCLIDARNKKIDATLFKNVSLEPQSIVLILTGMDKQFGTREYFDRHPIILESFAQELVRAKVKMVGIDFFSPDAYPFEVHKLLFKHGIFIIENLTHLEKLLKIERFVVVALPLKTETDSALARVVAVVDEQDREHSCETVCL